MKYSIGSSTVMMLRVLSLRRSSPAYSVVVLPEPVGPVTSRMPCGLWISSSMSCWVCASMPRESRSSLPACLSRIRSTTRSPCPEGMVETRTSTARPALEPRYPQRRPPAPRLQPLAQPPVDAEAHHEPVLERLDVDIGGVLLDRLGEHRTDQADDRGVVLAVQQLRLLA